MFFVILSVVLCIIAAFGTPRLIEVLAGTPDVKEIEPTKKQVKAEAEREKDFSYIGWQVVKRFEALPDTHRPDSFDIEAAIKALDFKHDVDSVNSHFPQESVRHIYGTPDCRCTTGRSPYAHHRSSFGYDYEYDAYGQRVEREVVTHKECQMYTEYTILLKEVLGIERDISAQKNALEKQERAVALAGIENDLRSVTDLTEALRNERSLIKETTTEIEKATAGIE